MAEEAKPMVPNVVHRATTSFLEFLDNRFVFRRVAFCWMMWLTTYASMWSFDFARSTAYSNGVEMAAVIGAVMGPIAVLQGAIFKWYQEARG